MSADECFGDNLILFHFILDFLSVQSILNNLLPTVLKQWDLSEYQAFTTLLYNWEKHRLTNISFNVMCLPLTLF